MNRTRNKNIVVAVGEITQRLGPALGLGIVLAAAAVFLVGQTAISEVNGFWSDEYFSMWASEPDQKFWDIFVSRIWPDTNPPLYYSLLYAARLASPDPRWAMTAVNVVALAAAGAITFEAARRQQRILLWGVSFGCFLISGPVLRFTAEGRSNLVALAIVFSVAWLTASLISMGRRAAPVSVLALLGALAAMAHVFAALMTCGLAAGLFTLFLFKGRRELLAPSLALALSSGVLTLAWALFALRHAGNISWIEYDLHSVRVALWEVRRNTFGSWIAVVAALLTVALSFQARAARQLTLAFGVALLTFLVVPLIASLKTPIIVGRYLLVGAPCVIVLLSFIASDLAARKSPAEWPGAIAGVLFLAFAFSSSWGGWHAAVEFVKAKPLWVAGAAQVREAAADCPDAAIIVVDSPALYAYASGLPATKFHEADVGDERRPPGDCPVVGWAEHVLPQWLAGLSVRDAPAEALLGRLALDARPDEVVIFRHDSGFVVFRGGSKTP